MGNILIRKLRRERIIRCKLVHGEWQCGYLHAEDELGVFDGALGGEGDVGSVDGDGGADEGVPSLWVSKGAQGVDSRCVYGD